jgi:hypothetical protein
LIEGSLEVKLPTIWTDARSSAFDFTNQCRTRGHAVTQSWGYWTTSRHAVVAIHSAHLCFRPRSRGHRGQPTGAAVNRGQLAVKPFWNFCNMAFAAWTSQL